MPLQMMRALPERSWGCGQPGFLGGSKDGHREKARGLLLIGVPRGSFFLDCEVHSENQSRPDNLPTPIGSFFSDGGSNLGI